MADEKYSPEKKAKQVVDRRRKSLDYWAPIYDEFAEVFQAVQCRTSPIYKRDAQGKELTEEDKTRTNVCMPGLSIMVRKNVARMTAQPPNIDFIARDPMVAQKLSSWHYWQYDVTGEAETRRKTVMQGEMFGIGVEKLFQDDVVVRRKVRVKTANATRTQLMTHQGHDPEQVKAHVSLLSENSRTTRSRRPKLR
jgi:hypothetical protein